jgi:hypothetical protein
MFKRIIATAAALVIGGLAIALPIVIPYVMTEAGTSTQSSNGINLNAAFVAVDAATGDNLYIYVSGFMYQQTYNAPNPPPTGGGGSSRTHTSQRANSDRTKTGGNGPTTYSQTSFNMQISRYTSQGEFVSQSEAFGTPSTFQVATDLSAGKLAGTFELDTYDTSGQEIAQTQVHVNVDFTATGALVTTKDSFRSHIKSPRQTYRSVSTNSHRTATASGVVMVDGVNLAAGGSQYADISTFDSRSMFSS